MTLAIIGATGALGHLTADTLLDRGVRAGDLLAGAGS